MKLIMDHHHHEKELDVDDEDEKSSSECSSGCQSGWTMYLDHSYGSRAVSMQQHQQQDYNEEEEEEGLSMVSDASSGPPHFHEDDDEDERCFCGGKKRRVNAEQQQQITKQEQHHSSLLDDTASSPLFGFSKTSCNATTANSNKKKQQLFAEDVSELSCGFSATQFKGKSALRKHLGYFKSCAAIKPTSVSKEGGSKNCGDGHRIQAFIPPF